MAEAAQSLSQSERNAQEEAAAAAELMRRATSQGRQELGDRVAEHIRFENLAINVPTENGQTVSLNDMSMYLDSQKYVLLGHTLSGTLTDESGQSRPVSIENWNQDIRIVPGSQMHKPYRKVMRMRGFMSAEQEAQIATLRAQRPQLEAQIALAEQHMANLPPDKRAQAMAVRQMMGGAQGSQAFKMLDMFTEDGAIEFVEEIEHIWVNPDLAQLFSAQAMAAGSTVVAPGWDNLVQRIQHGLLTLGYQPDSSDGSLTSLTIAAIAQFEAEYGLPIRGEATEAIASHIDMAIARDG